ncbi:MAG: TIGR04282 family arsenosugar biosynthesis glycosyltransferase [Angustibacter sp.]
MRTRSSQELTLLVLAKAPVAGRVKTRLVPALTPQQAAQIAAAALADTLDVVARADADRRVLVLEGDPGPWLPPGFEVVPQVPGGLDLRLAAAFEAARGPALLVGMDTPQLTGADLAVRFTGSRDAVLGMAQDGGFWAIGMARPCPQVFPGVPMSVPTTGRVQRERLRQQGFQVRDLAVRRDVDTIGDVRAVAAQAPGTRFARLARQLLDTGRVAS